MDTEILYGEALHEEEQAQARMGACMLVEWLHQDPEDRDPPNYEGWVKAILEVAHGLGLNTTGVREKLLAAPFDLRRDKKDRVVCFGDGTVVLLEGGAGRMFQPDEVPDLLAQLRAEEKFLQADTIEHELEQARASEVAAE